MANKGSRREGDKTAQPWFIKKKAIARKKNKQSKQARKKNRR